MISRRRDVTGRRWARSEVRRTVTKAKSVSVVDIPFELVGEVASAGAVAEAGNVESSAATRHDDLCWSWIFARISAEGSARPQS